MSVRTRPRLGLLCLTLAAGLGGCVTDDVPPLIVTETHPNTLIERSLSTCANKSVEAETACLRAALASSGSGVAAIAAMVPGCRLGRICTFDYTTQDRVGYLSAYATRLRHGFHVTLDFSKAPKSAAEVPVTVTVL